MEENPKSITSTVFWGLFDDESVRKKLSVMEKWEAMADDARNVFDLLTNAEQFLELGRCYKITLTIEDAGECK